jgi:hypothetical protein
MQYKYAVVHILPYCVHAWTIPGNCKAMQFFSFNNTKLVSILLVDYTD